MPAGGAGIDAVTSGVHRLTLQAPAPLDSQALISFLAARAVPGVEHAEAGRYVRTLRLPGGHGIADATAAGAGLDVELRLEDPLDLPAAVQRLRRLFDLDVEPLTVDGWLGADPVLAPLVRADPGRRVPGSADRFETTVRAIVGQQISVSGARTVASRIAQAVGERLRLVDEHVSVVFPAPGAVAAAPAEVFAMPSRRRESVIALASAVHEGDLRLDGVVDRDEFRQRVQAIPGIGPWTANYVCMRALGDPDVFLPTDLGARRGLAALGLDVAHAERWRPWRSYAMHHLWGIAARPPAP